MRFFLKILQAIILLGTLGFFLFFFRSQLQNLFLKLEHQYFPCQVPIAYSIGSFDKRFGISKESFISSIKDAESMWEKPVSKELFRYSPDGALKINLIYDDRQASTEKLSKLGIIVNDDQATYNELRIKHAALIAENKKKLQLLDGRIASFQARNNDYNNEVEKWNARGGAPPDVYAELNREKDALASDLASIKALQAEFNKDVEDINAIADVLNRLAETLHIEAARYNSIGRAASGEFTEGEYTSGPEGTAINVYQFDDNKKLVRVLAHELGHALGLEHVEEPKAIMYRLNNGINEKLTNSDLSAIKKLCKVL